MGTFITEWDKGAALCEQLFATPEASETAAGQLSRVAAHHGFDGWLLNIENKLSDTAIPNLLHFIRCASEWLPPGMKLLIPVPGSLASITGFV